VIAQYAWGASRDAGWSVRTWSMVDGSNNSIAGVVQTPDGYLWVATSAGMNQFDGVHFEHFPIGELVGLGNSNVRELLTSRTGAMWIALDGAVVCLKSGVAPRLIRDGVPASRVYSMVEDNAGSLWLGYRSGEICRITDGKVTTYAQESGMPPWPTNSLVIDTDNQLWAAKGSHIGIVRDGHFIEKAQTPAPAYLAPASRGGLWIGSGISIYRLEPGAALKQISSLPMNGDIREHMALFEDRDGILWVGTRSAGLFRYNASGLINVPTPQPRINCVTQDRHGDMWVGTEAGLDRVSARAIDVEGQEVGLPLGSVVSICEGKDQTVWAVGSDGSLKVRSAGGGAGGWTKPPFDFPAAASCVACDASGAIWIGTQSVRLFRWQNGKLTEWSSFAERYDPPDTEITALVPARNNDLWIGTSRKTVVHRLRDGQFTAFPLPAEGLDGIRAATEDQAGNIWMARFGRANLMRITDEKISELSNLLPNEFIQTMCVTPDNSLWIGFRKDVLGRLKDGKLSTIAVRQGLFDGNISQIIQDDRGWLWFGSAHGIFRCRLQELNDVADGKADHVQSVYYGNDEGIPALQARVGITPAAMRGKDGRIWMTTETALAIVHPDSVAEPLDPPPVYIRRATLDGATVASARDYLTGGAGNLPDLPGLATSPLRLPPGYQRLQFSFTAPTFDSPEAARFRYRLEGFDLDWNEVASPRTAVYPRLPAGNYRLKVIAANADGIWNNQGASVAITVTPFLWQRWWFISAAFALFVGVVFMLVRYVSLRRLNQQLQLARQRTALERERARIARDIHDDLGHGLTQIALLSDMTRQDPGASGNLDQQLEQIACTARQGIKSLDETVWAINPRNDTLPDLINYITHFVVQSLQPARIQWEMDLPEQTPVLMIPSEVRHALFLVVKEAINNVLRHAQADKVCLRITNSWDGIAIEIRDNGNGFVVQPGDASQDGLRNMNQRMLDIGGTFAIESAPGNGTQIAMMYRWSRVNGFGAAAEVGKTASN
jgi:signal transduction histidine kinase/ligand-binding sensor domain-containing protein